jgi:dTDP-4-dehydrorhamnose 3,5-epimerase
MINDSNYIEGFIEKTSIEGVYIINKKLFTDERGSFREALKLSTLETAIGTRFQVRTWNYAVSNPSVLRGIHSETCFKLIFPFSGTGYIAFVDMRPKSKTFGKYLGYGIKSPHEFTYFKAEGIGIGILCSGEIPLSFSYLMDKEYSDLKQQGLMWNDPDVKIPWPIKMPVLSERDKTNPSLRLLFPEKFK